MKCILALTDPILKCYPNYGHVLSIVGVHSNDYLPWIYNHFVQLYVPQKYDRGIRVDFVTPHMLKSFPWIESNFVNRNLIHKKWENIVDFVRDYINEGYYIYALFDVSKIKTYGVSNFWHHDPLIFGYDDEEEKIHLADNLQNGKYITSTASYRELINATESFENRVDVMDWLSGVYCLRYNKLYDFGNYRLTDNYIYEFNEKIYLELLEDYLLERNSFRRWSSPQNLIEKEDNNIWGIGIYSFLQEYLQYISTNSLEIDLRGVSVLMEHKVMIDNSVKFILDRKKRNINQSIQRILADNVNDSVIIRNLCMKYNIVRKEDIIFRINSKLLKMKEREENVFSEIIYLLKENI